MPQPLRTGCSVIHGPNVLRDRPELACEVGNVCANWSLLENDLMLLYALVMGDYLPKEKGHGPPTHPVAYQIFDSLNAFGPRLDLLDKLLAWRLSQSQVKHFREEIKPQLRRRFAERSAIAHGVWGTCVQYPDALILLPTYGQHMVYKKRDFEAVSNRIHEDHRKVGALMKEVYEQRQSRA
jgi:hypothetical protein